MPNNSSSQSKQGNSGSKSQGGGSSGSKSANVQSSWGSRSNFQASHGLKMDPEGLAEGNRMAEAYRQADARYSGKK